MVRQVRLKPYQQLRLQLIIAYQLSLMVAFQRGTHVLKALALGADLVGIGRPFSYGLALGGWEGVKAVADHMKMEINIAMQLTGCQTMADVKQMQIKTTFA